jgi:hypothetical protein
MVADGDEAKLLRRTSAADLTLIDGRNFMGSQLGGDWSQGNESGASRFFVGQARRNDV